MVLTVIAESKSVIAIDAATVTKALFCEEVVAGSVRSRPPQPRRGVYEITTLKSAKLAALHGWPMIDDRCVRAA